MSTTQHLLHANVLIALVVAEHEHHERAEEWFVTQAGVVLCPVVEGALLRYLLRIGESGRNAQRLLRAWRADPRVGFVADDLSYVDVEIEGVPGHRQVTDTYLVALAERHGMKLATFDIALNGLHPSATVMPGQ